jgi:hypothetical protein
VIRCTIATTFTFFFGTEFRFLPPTTLRIFNYICTIFVVTTSRLSVTLSVVGADAGSSATMTTATESGVSAGVVVTGAARSGAITGGAGADTSGLGAPGGAGAGAEVLAVAEQDHFCVKKHEAELVFAPRLLLLVAFLLHSVPNVLDELYETHFQTM